MTVAIGEPESLGGRLLAAAENYTFMGFYIKLHAESSAGASP